MGVVFSRKSLPEMLLLVAGGALAVYGQQQGMDSLLGLGVVIIGCSVAYGGLGAIRRREIGFLHRDARFLARRYTGSAAVIWGVMMAAVGATVVAGGVLILLGYREWLAGQVRDPALWFLGVGCYAAFTLAAMTLQTAQQGGSTAARLAVLPKILVGLVLIVGFALLAAVGAWGLMHPAAFDRRWTEASQWWDQRVGGGVRAAMTQAQPVGLPHAVLSPDRSPGAASGILSSWAHGPESARFG